MVTRIDVKKLIAVILIAIITLVACGYSVMKLNEKFEITGKLTQAFGHNDNEVTVTAIPTQLQDQLKDGTSLSFGDPTKPVIALIATPQDISRDTSIIGDKPSPLLNAVKDKKILLNIYLTDEQGGSSTGIRSLTQAAACNMYRDKTPGKIATLNRIVSNGGGILPDDDYKTAVEKLGMDESVYQACIDDSNRQDKISSASINTETNTQYFMQTLHITTPPFIIVDGQAATRIDVFNDDFVDNVITKRPILSSIRDDVSVKAASLVEGGK